MGLFGVDWYGLMHGGQQPEPSLKQQRFAEEKRQHDLSDQLRVLEADRKVRPLLDEAYQRFGGDAKDPTNPGDPKQLGATIDDIFKAYAIETRRNVSPDLLKALKDPKFGADVLKFSQDQGLTISDIMKGGESPLLRVQGRLAIAKHMDSSEAQRAAAAGDQPTASPAQAAQANASPLGSGLQMAGGPAAAPIISAPAAPAPSPVAAGGEGQPSAPAPVAAPQLPPAATAPTGMPQALTPELQGAANTLQDRITNLKANIAIIAKKSPDSKALPILNEQLKTNQEHLFQITAKSAQGQAEAEAQVGRTPVPLPELQRGQLAIGTRFRDLGNKPGVVPQSPAQEAAAIGGVHSAQKEFDTTVEQGAHARRSYDLLDLASSAARNAGVTGPWVTPIRENLYKMGNLFGVNTKGQTALQVMSSLTPQFAIDLTQMMKGQQSDREFMAGIDSALNKGQTQQAFATLAYLKKEQAILQMEQALQARAWQGKYGSLAFKDANDRTFAEAWNKYREEDIQRNGSFGDRATRALNLDYKQVLKGNITNASKRGG